MDRSLLDTDIFSEVLKRKDPAVLANTADYLIQHGRLTVSVLTVTEVVAGYQQADRPDLLGAFYAAIEANQTLPFGDIEARLAGEIIGALRRSGQSIGHFDPMIAATALVSDCVLVTGNTRHYERVRVMGYDLRLANWRER